MKRAFECEPIGLSFMHVSVRHAINPKNETNRPTRRICWQRLSLRFSYLINLFTDMMDQSITSTWRGKGGVNSLGLATNCQHSKMRCFFVTFAYLPHSAWSASMRRSNPVEFPHSSAHRVVVRAGSEQDLSTYAVSFHNTFQQHGTSPVMQLGLLCERKVKASAKDEGSMSFAPPRGTTAWTGVSPTILATVGGNSRGMIGHR